MHQAKTCILEVDITRGSLAAKTRPGTFWHSVNIDLGHFLAFNVQLTLHVTKTKKQLVRLKNTFT